MCLFGVVVLHRSMVGWIQPEGVWGVVVLHSLVDKRRGGVLPWVYVHSAIYDTYLVRVVLHRSMVD